MKKILFLLFSLITITSKAQVNVVGYIQTNGVANYPTHIDSMGKGGYIVAGDTIERNAIPCLRRKYGMAVYVQNQQKLYILKDSSCANVWQIFSGGSGGSQDLQQVLEVGHSLIDEKNFQGTEAGKSSTGTNTNAFGYRAAVNNTGTNVNAFGTYAGKDNVSNNINAFGVNAADSNMNANVNAFGGYAAQYNTGESVNALGYGAANTNSGGNVNVMGNGALYNNSGTNVNAFGYAAGANNTRSSVNLFGNQTTASEDNQVVFSNTATKNVRIKYSCSTDADNEYNLPSNDGNFMISADPLINSAGDHSSYTITNPGIYEVSDIDADKSPFTIYLPDPTNGCHVFGQRIIITNIPSGSTNGKIDLDGTYPVYYRGTNLQITFVGVGESMEIYSDGLNWRTISSLPEPVVNLDMDALGAEYYINSNGTYNVTVASSTYPIVFPPPCYMTGGHITLINRDGTNSQTINVSKPLDCSTSDIINPVTNGSISSISPHSTSTYISVNGEWIQITERH